jgi:hypothetical protein
MPKVAFGWGVLILDAQGSFLDGQMLFYTARRDNIVYWKTKRKINDDLPHGLTEAQRDIDGQRACSVRPSDFLHVHVNKNNLTW